MKRALQAILIAGDVAKADVLYGRKKITIREGYRDYVLGPVLIGCHILSWATMRNITRVQHKTLKEVTVEEYEADGFKTRGDMIKGLKEFYPDINFDSPITIIEWD